jgi:hypothetical protein
MKKFKVLLLPGLIGLMCLALFAQEPQGSGGQGGSPGDGAGARGGAGVGRREVEVDRREAAEAAPKTFRC